MKEQFNQAFNARNTLSEKGLVEEGLKPFDINNFVMDLQLFGKGGGKGGKVLFSVLFGAAGLGIGAAFGVTGMGLVNATIIGASIGGTIWSATHKANMGNDSPSIQRFDRVQESMSATASIPVVYGTRKISGNQTFHETNAKQNTLHKHVVLCEGGIEGVQSVCANDLLIPTGNQTKGTVFTLTNIEYEDARAWKDGKTLHLYCNGKDNAIYLCNKDDAENADTYYQWQTSIDSLISYINRLGDGWQAFPLATTTKYPGDLSCESGYSLSETKTVSNSVFKKSYVEPSVRYETKRGSGNAVTKLVADKKNPQAFKKGDKLTLSTNSYVVIKDINYPATKNKTVKYKGKDWTYTAKTDSHTTPVSYVVEVYKKIGSTCYNATVDLTAATVTGGTTYKFHDSEPPANYEDVGGYPQMAWLDMTFKTSDELNGNPSVTCIVKGKKVYDPRTNQTAFSDNPALCVRDFLLSKRYGLGRWINETDLDDDSFISSANYCDQKITVYDADNRPYKSKRYTLNMVIDQRQDAIKWLQEILANFGAWLVISKNKIKLLVEKPSPVCYTFNDDNVKDLKVAPLKANDTPNHYQITITDSTMWKNVALVVDDFADQKARGKVISKDVELTGVTSQAQALRLARYYSDYNLSCPVTLSFTTGIEAMALECGDVVSVTYRDTFKNMPIRISAIRETADNEFEISGRQYNPDIYSDNLGGGIQGRNYATNKDSGEGGEYFTVPDVTHLEAKTVVRKDIDGKTKYDIRVSYLLPLIHYVETAQVYYKINATDKKTNNKVFEKGVPANQLGYQGGWISAGESISQIIIPNVKVGETYKIRVLTKTKKGKLTDIDEAPEVICKVRAKSTVPAKPYNLMYNFDREFRFIWQDVDDSDVIYYEVRTNKNVGETEGLLGRCTAPTIAVRLTKRKGTVYVFSVNGKKKASAPAWVNYEYPKPLAPTNIDFVNLPRGIRIVAPAFPSSCNSVNFYITSSAVSEKIKSNNTVYTYNGEPNVYFLRAAYVDMLGEGYTSQEFSFTINAYIDPSWIEEASLSIDKVDTHLRNLVTTANGAIPRLGTVENNIKEIDTNIETINGSIESINTDILDIQGDITEITKEDGLIESTIKKYDNKSRSDFAAQIKQTESNIVSTVAKNKREQDNTNNQILSQITQETDGVTQKIESRLGVTWDENADNGKGGKGAYVGGVVDRITEVKTNLEGFQATVKENIEGAMAQNLAQLKEQADSISSTVQETIYGKEGTKDKPTGGLVKDISQAIQTAKGFTTLSIKNVVDNLNSTDTRNSPYKIVQQLAKETVSSADGVKTTLQDRFGVKWVEETKDKNGKITPAHYEGGIVKDISEVSQATNAVTTRVEGVESALNADWSAMSEKEKAEFKEKYKIIAETKVTADSVQSTVQGFSTDLNKKWKDMSEDEKKSFAEKYAAISQIKQTSDSISSKVQGLQDEVLGKEDEKTHKRSGGIKDTVANTKKVADDCNSFIQQNKASITQMISAMGETSKKELTAIENEKDSNKKAALIKKYQEKYPSSAITQLLDSINLRVQKNDIISQINITPGTVSIKGKYINIDGDTQIGDSIITGKMIQTDAIRANHIKSDSVTADKINVESLSAICAKIGTLKTAETGARVVIKDNLIQVFDKNNTCRVKLGVW